MSIRSSSTFCFEAVRWIPIIFIVGVIAWSYYAYVVQMCIATIDNVPKKVTYLCVYHVLLILVLWCYYRTVFKYYIGPPRQFYIGDVEGERLATAQTVDERRTGLVRLSRQANLSLLTRHVDGSIRYCFVCQCIKPDRAHHCSVCARCVLRYDHHCPWTNSCISYGNYKFFILFLGWSLVFCIFIGATTLQYFLLFWQDASHSTKDETNSTSTTSGRVNLLFLFFVAIIFAISVASLFFYHLFLIGRNRTTIESYRAPVFVNGPQKHGFDLGWKRNYQEIFGTSIFTALMPIFTTRGDGVHFEINHILIEDLQQHQQQSQNPTGDVLLPVEGGFNPMGYDRGYLLTENNEERSTK